MGLSLADLASSDFNWSDFKGKVAILGYGLEGEATLKYLAQRGLNLSQISIYDASEKPKLEIPEGCRFHGGKDYIAKLNQNSEIEIIFRSPPIAPSLIQSGAIVWSGTNEFLARVKSLNLIGVTGTKGKGTTSSLVHEMLIAEGKTSYLLGNIGQPALSLIDKIQPEDYAVIELSSFQLWDIKFSPQVAAILMITEDHLDVHSDVGDYRNAKFNITKFQKPDDALIYFSDNKFSAEFGSKSPAAKKMPYPAQEFAHMKGESIKFSDQLICSTSDVQLIGSHNLENVMAAVNIAKSLNLSNKSIKKAITNFKGLPHRLQFVREVSGIKFYDNSQATSSDSVGVSLKSFPGRNKLVLMGGRNKGLDFSKLFSSIKDDKIDFIFYGEAVEYLESLAKQNELSYKVIKLNKMADIVRLSYDTAKLNDSQVVILSPGMASFDMFESYIDRGNQFIKAVNELL
jgi:UDP-N-acetylmuramoylalanine--D-glutamate ligase